MGKEYIDRDEYCEYFCRCAGSKCDKSLCNIWTMKAADVAPVVHSEWINYGGGNATCRRCGVRQRAVYDDDNDQNFCGHCGAKMDGGGK